MTGVRRLLRAGALAACLIGLAASPAAADRWDPPAQVTWQWQLSGRLDTSLDVDVYDVDLFETDAATVAQLRADGRRTICYVSAGSWERYRPDRDAFPAADLGRPLDGYPDERWLDVRDIPGLAPVMRARLDLCREKGFDAVELDNVDGYVNASGFPLSASDQLAYNRFLAGEAHARGLAVALKNDLDQVAELEPDFDLAINEQCFQYRECDGLEPFVDAGKPVLHVEYKLKPAKFCSKARALGFSSMRKRVSLDAYRRPC